jgi:hypothetical protein
MAVTAVIYTNTIEVCCVTKNTFQKSLLSTENCTSQSGPTSFLLVQPFIYPILKINNDCARGSVVVKALCHKPEGRGFDTR